MWSYSHIFARFAKKLFHIFQQTHTSTTTAQHSEFVTFNIQFSFVSHSKLSVYLALYEKWFDKYAKKRKWNVKVISSVDDVIFGIAMCISVKGAVKCSSLIRKRIFWAISKFPKMLADLFCWLVWYKFRPNSDKSRKNRKWSFIKKAKFLPLFCVFVLKFVLKIRKKDDSFE